MILQLKKSKTDIKHIDIEIIITIINNFVCPVTIF